VTVASAYETILLDVGPDGVAKVTLNRPDVRNALNRRMVDDLHAALETLKRREDVRALVIAAAGGKAFMSGADIAEMRNRGRAVALEGINSRLFARVETFPHPTVAAVVGFCLGGGCELAIACDFRVAGESSKFGQPEVGLGIMAAAGGTRRLPALVGLAQARRLLFGAEVIDAVEAKRIGLVDRLVPDAAVEGEARALLEPILRQSREAVLRTKRAILAWLHGAPEADLLRNDHEAQADLFEHPEKYARMDAFLAKRKAKP
jgi:enoyl-CoA hydratase